MEVRAKPPELLALHDVTAELFETLRGWFAVDDRVTFDLSAVDSEAAVRELGEPRQIAAFAMRKLQALHLLSTPGVRTSTDVVVSLVQDLTRALLQAPNMRLNLAAEDMDWDAAFDDLLTVEPGAAPESIDASDPEAEHFEQLHGLLHVAVQAVLDTSDGEIVYLE